MAFIYSEFCVLWTYRNSNREDDNPGVADLQRWDSLLIYNYEQRLVSAMTHRGIPLTRENKSRIVALAEVSNGELEDKIDSACTFFTKAMSLPLDSQALEEVVVTARAKRRTPLIAKSKTKWKKARKRPPH